MKTAKECEKSIFVFILLVFTGTFYTLVCNSSLLALQTLRAELHGFKWGVLSPPNNHQSWNSKGICDGDKSTEIILQWKLKKLTNTNSGLQFHYQVELNLDYSVTKNSSYSFILGHHSPWDISLLWHTKELLEPVVDWVSLLILLKTNPSCWMHEQILLSMENRDLWLWVNGKGCTSST